MRMVNLHCDIHIALNLIANQMMDYRMKHIHIKYQFIKHGVSNKSLQLFKIDVRFNPIDKLIKVIILEVLVDIALLCRFCMSSFDTNFITLIYFYSIMY